IATAHEATRTGDKDARLLTAYLRRKRSPNPRHFPPAPTTPSVPRPLRRTSPSGSLSARNDGQSTPYRARHNERLAKHHTLAPRALTVGARLSRVWELHATTYTIGREANRAISRPQSPAPLTLASA
ncbi:hypothetical protein CERZMDRAFT_119625, partial [Cercospora zeae-maydis SCOH1-5]